MLVMQIELVFSSITVIDLFKINSIVGKIYYKLERYSLV